MRSLTYLTGCVLASILCIPANAAGVGAQTISFRARVSAPMRPVDPYRVPTAQLRRLFATSTNSHASRGSTLRPLARSLTVSNAQDLQIPWSKWPSNAAKETGTVISAKNADNPNVVLFADNAFHRGAYSTHGLIGGYDQNARLNFGNYGDYLYAEWLGTYYGTPDQASGRVDDAVQTLAFSGAKPQSCYLPGEPNCKMFIFQYVGPQQFAYVAYAIWSNQNAVGEVAILSNPYSMIEYESPLGQDISSLLAAGDAALLAAGGTPSAAPVSSASPSAPSVTVDGFSVLHSVKGHLKRTSRLHLNETGYFFTYFRMSGVGTYNSRGDVNLLYPRARLTMTKDGTTIFSGSGDISSTPTARLFAAVEGSFSDARAEGSVSAQFTVTLGSSASNKTVALTITQPVTLR